MCPQTGVVERCLYAGAPELGRQFLGPVPAPHIYYPRAGNAVTDASDLAGLVLGLADYVTEVGTLEAGFQDEFFLEGKAVHDIPGHKGSSGGGERYHRGIYLLSDITYLKVIGAEVIAPLGYAVGFVHHIGHVENAQVCVESPGFQALRAKVQELVIPVGGVVKGKVHFTAVHACMDGHSPYAAGFKVLDLVFHEGYQGRDHKGYSVLHEGRHLEAHALAASRWEDGKDVTALQCIGDYLLLHGPEGLVAPVCLQYFLRIHSNVPQNLLRYCFFLRFAV